jgi:serine/threonine protein kinase/Tol biopolymer transport system component
MADQFPEKFGKYKIIEEVGRGGFADVYKAIDTTLDRTVALKFLEPRLLLEPTFVERFQREAKLAANLKHPNIVFIHEFGWEAGTVYMAMEFLEGQPLKEVILEEGALHPKRIVNIVGQVASALDYAHGRGLVHRDIKPSNIMVGADDHVTVMDFGIAKAATLTALTTTGRIFGTPEYMSPEQAEGEGELDARSDVYSLGVVVYKMFTGKVPFSGTTPLSIMRGHADKPPPRPSEINPDVPPAVEAVLLKALAKKREERYQSAGEMAAALKQAVSGAVAEPVPAPPPAEPARPALPWKWVAGIGAAVVVVVGLLIALARGGGPSTPTPEPPTAAAVARATTPAPTVAPTVTPIPPTDTPVPPTSTPTPPTNTLLPPTFTSTPTPVLPTATPSPSPTSIAVVALPTPTSTSTPTLTATATPIATPTAAPTGKIAFTLWDGAKYDVWVANVDGSGRAMIIGEMRQPAFSPDGSRIAVNGERRDQMNLHVADANGSNLIEVSEHLEDSRPNWAPDGYHIVFNSTVHGDRRSRIYILDDVFNRTEGHVLRSASGDTLGRDPYWLPDGRIVYKGCDYWAGDANCGLYIVPPDGSATPTQLTTDSSDMAPAAHGNKVAFMSIRDGNWEIYSINTDGSDLKRLTNNGVNDGLPTFSPDGQFITFVSDEGGKWAIWAMNADGSGRRKLFGLNGGYGIGEEYDWTTERISWAP